MASRIKGITVEIGGDTTGLDKALTTVNSSLSKTQSALNDVNKLLKLDPANTTLVEQKQELLSKAVANTSKKLEALEDAQEQVAEAFKNGDIGKDKYMAFQREIEETRGKLNQYKADLSNLQSEQTNLATNLSRLQKLFDATGTEVNDYTDILGNKLTSAIRNGTASSEQLSSAIDKIGRAATGGKADVKQLREALDTVDDGEALRNLIKELKNVGNTADQTTEDVGEIAEITKGAAFVEAAEQISAVGDKIQEVGEKAVEAYTEVENAVTKVNAYFGETGDAAETSAKVIKSVYEAGVGESMDSVANAVLAVKKHLGDLSETDLTNITQQAITLDEVYGIDMNETLRGVNSLMQQYGLTAQEAMDYIVKGTENGLDKTNELGDNLSEYSGKFSQAGYSASEYFQLLDNGLKNGAYNLDKVNDAINEATTRLADGTIGESIGSFSDKTQELFASWQNGGATQKEVIDSIVADIGNCTSQQDALNMAALAFGTMAEDGNLKFITSLTSVGNTYDSVSGSAQGLFDATSTPMQEMEANTRQLQQSLVPLGERIMDLANTIMPLLVAIITTISGWFEKLPGPVQDFAIVLGVLLAVFAALTPVIIVLTVAVGALNVSIFPIIAIIAGVIAAIAAVIAIGKLLYENWDVIKQKAGEIKENIAKSWNELKTKTVETWNNVKSKISESWSNIKSNVSSTVENVKSKVSQGWNTLKSTTANVWSNIQGTIQKNGGGIKGVLTTAVEGYKNLWRIGFQAMDSLTGGQLGNMLSTVRSKLDSVKNAFSEKLNAAKTAVQTIINNIKSLFNFSWSLPKLKLPHVKISGSFSLFPPSVPKFSIEWYKKAMNQAYVLNGASIFGSMNGKLLGGGEKGSEMIVGTQYLLDMIQRASSGKDNLAVTAFESMTNRIVGIMAEYFPQFANMQMVMDTGTLVGVLTPEVDAKLGQIAGFKERRI